MKYSNDRVYRDLTYYQYVFNHPNDIPFWINITRRLSAKNILEIGVGDGRIAFPLIENGFFVTGIDISEKMLAAAESHRRNMKTTVRDRLELINANMTNFKISKKFDLVIITSLTFQHLLTIDDQLSCLRMIKEHLCNEGFLIIDVFNPNFTILSDAMSKYPKLVRYLYTFGNEKEIIRDDASSFESCTQNMEVQSTVEYYTAGHLVDKEFVINIGHIFFPREMELLLRLEKFALIEKFGDHDFSNFESFSPRQIVIAKCKA
ncbi:MAG: class I SAM-dependent methyltransferase [Ignavibacteria bacterium]|nr:class I SAM-dependent methyltransferase [Ignavibacteria bacterium]